MNLEDALGGWPAGGGNNPPTNPSWPAAGGGGGGGAWPGGPAPAAGGGAWPAGPAPAAGGGAWPAGPAAGGGGWPAGPAPAAGGGAWPAGPAPAAGGGAWPAGPAPAAGGGAWPGPQPGGQPGGGGAWPGPQPGGQMPSQPSQPGWPSPSPGPGPGPGRGPGPGPGYAPQQSLTVPYSMPLPGGVYDKMLITIAGTIKSNADKFIIDLSTSTDLAFHFNPRFNEGGKKVIVRNSFISKKWGREERDLQNFPFQQGKPFEMKILCTNKEFKVAVNNSHVLTFHHRVSNLRSINVLNIFHDVTLSKVNVETMP
ncbi:galectin-3b [Trematomus bernacchii]|uniref:galectin-3b n=1 Tax=Trematomus bernacchii TaxID=40690 RepID=UPI001469D925|nr:galectin-3b [Trematomus bernacchii]